MDGGKLLNKIVFKKDTLVPDGGGGFVSGGFSDVLETWAEIKQVKASRLAEHLQDKLKAVYEVRLRMRDGFDPMSYYSVEWRGKSYVINEVAEDVERSSYWLLKVVYNGDSI